MVVLSEFLLTDTAAAWAVAGELGGGNVAARAAIYAFGPIGLTAAAVGAASFTGTTALDKYFDGALHETFGEVIESTIEKAAQGVKVIMDLFGDSNAYHAPSFEGQTFFGESFDSSDESMMNLMCKTWDIYWPSATDGTTSTPAETIVIPAVDGQANIPKLVGVPPAGVEFPYLA